MFARVLVLLSFLAPAQLCYPQDYIFNRLSIQDGLLSNNIRTIWQDSTGYLWLGSENGLQRFDGNIFRTILQLPVDQVLPSSKGKAWVRSGKKVFLFHPQTFAMDEISYEKNSYAAEVHLGRDASGNAFIITDKKTCQYYNEMTKRFSVQNNPFTLPGSFAVKSVTEDLFKNRYWIVSDSGLAYWNKKAKSFHTLKNNEQQDPLLADTRLAVPVVQFFIDKKNRYWIETSDKNVKKFYCFDAIRNQFTNDTTGLADAGNGNYFEVNGFMQYNDSIIAVYGLNCLRIKDNQHFHELRDPRNNPYNIHFNTVSAIFEDRERIIWIATDNGLYNTKGTLSKNIHVIFNKEHSRGSVTSVLEDAQQRIWIGTWGRGIHIMDVQPGGYPQLQPVKQPPGFSGLVWSLCEDRPQGKVWAGCENGGLLVFNKPNQTPLVYQPEIFNGSAVRQIIKDRNAVLWFGLYNGDLVRYAGPAEPVRESSFKKVFSFSGPVTKLTNASGNNIWVSVKGRGLYLFDTKNEKIVQSFDINTVKDDLITGVNDILPFDDSTFLLAAGQLGMLHVKTSTIDFLSTLDNTVIGTAHTLQKDNHGDYWIGSSNGIFKLNAKTKTITRYSQYDGLITVHNNSYIPETSITLSDNRLVFAGNQHLLVFDPDDYRSSKPPADVTITGFQLNDRYLQTDSLLQLNRIRIPYSRNAFTIAFVSPGFLQSGKLTYEYKMEGIEENWLSTKSVVPVKYNFLPPGNYTFQVRARNDEGLYSGITTVKLRIVPPFRKTGWFYALLILLILSIFFYLHRLRLQRLLQVEKVRTRLARDLHDDMGSTLSTINILSNMALQQTPLDEKTGKDYMNTISMSTTQMMEAMDDIVWSINPVNDSMAKVLARMKEIAGAVLEPKQVDYHFDADNAVMQLHFSMESRREIFLIFKEALNNIIKYANCSSVQFVLQKQGNNLILLIEDSGMGFESLSDQPATRGNGMKNMQKRAENVKGHLSVVSAPGRGTRITLSIPIA